jgi:hypothetical protein
VCKMAEDAGHLTFFGLLDLEGFGYANFSFQLVKTAIGVLQDFHPERLGSIYVLNAPFVFTAIWRMIQPLLDERTRSKIDILGSNLEKLKEHIDPAVLETKYGGTHEEYPVPDAIAQIALENEKKLVAAAAAAGGAGADDRTSGTATPPEPSTPTGQHASAPVAGGGSSRRVALKAAEAERQVTKKKRSLRRMLKQMLFNTERRAAAASLGQDPNALDDSPVRLTSAGASSSSSPIKGAAVAAAVGGGGGAINRVLSTASGRGIDDEELPIDPDEDEDFVKLKVAHDKLLGKVMDLDRKLDDLTKRFQTQFYAVLGMMVGVVAWQMATVYQQQQHQ